MTPVTATTVGTRSTLRVPTVAQFVSGTALTGLVAALVLGILGMHALASHGTPAPAPVVATSVADGSSMRTTGAMSHEAAMMSGGSQESHAHGSAALHPSMSTGMSDSGRSGHDMTGMMMLCVVVLAAAALGLLALLVVRILIPLLPGAFRPAAAPERVLQWVRGTGPPPTWQFSVIRC